MANKELGFLDYVQEHERAWGNDTYTNRPNLQDFLGAGVVVFWMPVGVETPRRTATLHKSLDELQDYFAKFLLRGTLEPPKQRIVQIFAQGKPVRIKGVRVEFEVSER